MRVWEVAFRSGIVEYVSAGSVVEAKRVAALLLPEDRPGKPREVNSLPHRLYRSRQGLLAIGSRPDFAAQWLNTQAILMICPLRVEPADMTLAEEFSLVIEDGGLRIDHAGELLDRWPQVHVGLRELVQQLRLSIRKYIAGQRERAQENETRSKAG